MTETLEVTPLARAIARLDEGLERYRRDVADEQIRDGLIQRFEFTYEVSHKTLKRYLELVSPTPAVYDAMAFADLVGSANQQGLLLSDWGQWKKYREMQAKTSHTYNERVALEVVEDLPGFLSEVKFLLARIEERIAL